jgi:hypothetical protein
MVAIIPKVDLLSISGKAARLFAAAVLPHLLG